MERMTPEARLLFMQAGELAAARKREERGIEGDAHVTEVQITAEDFREAIADWEGRAKLVQTSWGGGLHVDMAERYRRLPSTGPIDVQHFQDVMA